MALDRKRLLKPVKKLRKLLRKIDRQPAPEEVHDFRTSTRRLEAAFEAFWLDRKGIGKSAVEDLRRCRKRAGRVRDMDVLTNFASTIHLAGEEECAVQLLEHLGAKRKKYATKLYDEIRGLRSVLRKDLSRTATRFTKIAQAKTGGQSDNAVGPRAAGTAVRLAVQLAVPRRLDKANLHPYRLKVKELRNILQMAPNDNSRFSNDLAKVKDAIGEWHDWEELLSIARKKLDHGSRCALLAELQRISGRKYDQAFALAQALRRDYLESSHPQKGRSAASGSVPRRPVWEAIAMLAG